MTNRIWLFSDENGNILGFNSFSEARKYAFEIYDKDLKFSQKINKTRYYKNCWNDEDVSISKLKMHKSKVKEDLKDEN